VTFSHPAAGVAALVVEAAAVTTGAVDAGVVAAAVAVGSNVVVPAPTVTGGAVVVDDVEPSLHAAITPSRATAIAAARFTVQSRHRATRAAL
jgi:K+ transporter